MAVLNVGKVAQSSCDLDKYHGFSIGRAVELKQLSYSEWEQSHHFIVYWFYLNVSIRVREALYRSNCVVK